MNWKVIYVNSSDDTGNIKSIEDIASSGLKQLAVTLPAVIPDNTGCYYFATFNSFEYDFVHFDEIDTLAEIYINGNKVFTTSKEEFTYDIVDGIKPGDNEIVVFVHPKFGKKTLGDIYVKRTKKCQIVNPSITVVEANSESETATVNFKADFKLRDDSTHDFNELSYKIILKDEKKVTDAEGRLSINHIDQNVSVQKARLWWPKGYGKPILYDAQIQVCDGNKLLDVYDVRLPLFTDESSVGVFNINSKKLTLNGPYVSSFDSIEVLCDTLSKLGCNSCTLARDKKYFSDETLEKLYENGIYPIFSKSVPESLKKPEEIKNAIEKYRIEKLYRPSWELSDNAELAYCVKCASLPIMLCIDPKTNDIFVVNELPYSENVTYTVKDLDAQNKLVATDIVDIEPNSTKKIGTLNAEKGHNYLINWTLESGKKHANHYFSDYGNLTDDSYTELLKKCGFGTNDN